MAEASQYMEAKEVNEEWDLVIEPKAGLSLRLKELWAYRDLLGLMVQRDIVTVYKQTILGPIWFFAQPILTTLIFTVVFGNIAGISTDGLPKVLFYMSGLVLWNFFSESLNTTSKTFTENASLFGKVYFPRIVMPVAKVLSGMIKFGIQFALFLGIYLYFLLFTNVSIHFTLYLLLVPVFILILALMGLGFGILFSSLTTKYRDLIFLLSFGVQLLMYATPVIYPSSVLSGKYSTLLALNPLSSLIEGFRLAFLGVGAFDWMAFAYSCGFTFALLFLGILVFNKVEKTFMDTV